MPNGLGKWRGCLFDLSITIVSYNNKRDIIACLESLLLYEKQNGLTMQIFIVNNSPKQSCCDLADKFPVKVLELNENKGFGSGHNAVIPFLDSRYHVVLNPDIIFHESVFGKLVKHLDENSHIGACAPLIVDDKENLQEVYRREITVYDLICRYAPFPLCALPGCQKRRRFHIMRNVDKSAPFECEFIQGSFLVIPTTLFKKIKGFDERFFMYAEDADLCKRIRQMHKTVECFPECKVVHKWERASHRSFKLFRIHAVSLVKYFCKWKFTRGG